MTDRTVTLGKFFAHYSTDTSFAQCEYAGWSLRAGAHLFVIGHYDYRDKKKRSWPKWLRVRIVLWRVA